MSVPEPVGHDRSRVFILTLGCPKNEVDSDRMRADLEARGFVLVEDANDADTVIVNTCGFIRDAVEESIETVLDLEDWRDARPGRRLVVAGCLVSRYGDELAESMPEIDAFVAVADEDSIASAVSASATEPQRSVDSPTRLDSGPSAYLQVSDGCDRSCAYCTIPAIRGPYRSRPLAELVDEAQLLVSRGAREIVLIGQDTSVYGRDLPEDVALVDVIAALAPIEQLRWIRLMYVQPDGVTDELITAMAAEPKVCHYIDMPLQHASRSVLRAMHRSGSGEEFLGTLDRLRAAMPDIVLRTTVIAGYPGETPADAEELDQFIEDGRFDYVAVFPYSPEEGTVAAELPGLPERHTRIARAQRIRDLADEIGWDRAFERLDTVLEVLSEGVDDDGVAVGRWRGQAPDVDGLVLLDREVPPGDLVSVRIKDTAGYDLEGEVL